MSDTIACISTPLGRGAISIIRMSGAESLKIAEQVFSSNKLNYKNIIPNFLYLGNFKIKEMNERCFMVHFRAPYSYTGEDMVEFQVHGGTLLTQKILETLISCGARLAEHGEFSRRAFENGKLSLDEAEAIIGEINAESEGELAASLSVAGGQLKTAVEVLQGQLTECLAQIEAVLDYPEEDFEEETKDSVFFTLQEIESKIKGLVKNSESLKYINNGINIAIVGAPNVGKSSLLNALLGRERAIVTDIEGTTRDTISDSISYNGIKLNLVDTAGLRETSDIVEQIGVEKSKATIEHADIVLFILDGSRAMTQEEEDILKELKNKNHLVIVNKSDKERVLNRQEGEIEISALKGKNIEKLKDEIFKKVIKDEIDFNKIAVANERQLSALKQSANIIESITNDTSMDIIAMQIKLLWQTLGKITGMTENEEIIDLIFEKFCLGK